MNSRELVSRLTRAVVYGVILSYGAISDSRVSAEHVNSSERQQARQIIEATGVTGGLIVHVGCGDGKLTAALRVNDRFRVHGLDTNAANVETARNHIASLGMYGDVSIDRMTGDGLPYVDNLVNLVVSEDLGDVPMDEVMRVLAPRGVAYVHTDGGWKKTVKPQPDDIDQWTHFMHDSSGNAVAHDTVVGPPRHLQWTASPRWSRHHDRMASTSAMVSSGGRVFYIVDEGSRVSIQMPAKWALIARDAFNGSFLWKQPIPTWHSHLWPLKSGPTQLARRLVAVDDVVYVTLGFKAPLTAIDAATGATLRTYEDTRATEEVIVTAGTVLALVNKGASELEDFAPEFNVGDQKRVAGEFHWNEQPRELMAIDADTGQSRWQKTTTVAPMTLCADGEHVLYHDGERVVCLDLANGEPIWDAPAARRESITMNFGPRVVIHDDVVLFAGGDRKMTAFAVATGETLWSAPHDKSAYSSPEDLLVTGGLVWSAPTTSTGDSGIFTGRDVRTGEVKVQFPPDVDTYWFHHRCYMAKATDRFLLPSRTGIEFVDFADEHWDINHWVRGGCLYGIMPANGLTYTPPHDCACYPETKLYGLNALASASPSRQLPDEIPEEGRLERGPAYDEIPPAEPAKANGDDWPTFRHDPGRSGSTEAGVPTDLAPAWQAELGGKLSSVSVAGGKLYVARVDAHTVESLDAKTGERLWSYTTGGRVDSPPTINGNRVLFGSADGWVYCLRATDGELAWRFRAAPLDRRLVAYDQLESVWPVHGSVLVEDGIAYFVAGRSTFLDGGLRLYRLDVATGRKLTEMPLDQRDPESGENIQARVKILNMPVGLPDVLSSDEDYVYMRSQRFVRPGTRVDLGPHSGTPAEQGSTQTGGGIHLFAPMGFLDDTWFHRAYWVYGRSFAGGHAGYYQAGKYTPAGRMLVFDGDSVYGFARKPQYYRWTTTMEHELFATGKEPPPLPKNVRRGEPSMIRVEKTKSLDPSIKPIAVEAWVKATKPEGVVVARGGPSHGYALVIRDGAPRFIARVQGKVFAAGAKKKIVGDWAHLAGVLTADHQIKLYVNGELAATTEASGFISTDPLQAMEIGADDAGSVGNYKSPLALTGSIDEVRVYDGTLTEEEIKTHFSDPGNASAEKAKLVLSYSFDDGNATDASGSENHGKLAGAQPTKGKHGGAMAFTGPVAGNAGSFVRHRWNSDVPLYVNAMVLADKTLFIAGPPDVLDEEESFARLTRRDPDVHEDIARQDAALEGRDGGILQAVGAADGKKLAEIKLDALPVWDGMAAAGGRLYIATKDGRVICYRGRE